MAKKEHVENFRHLKLDWSDRAIRGFTYVFVTLFAVACIIPFWLIISSSFSSESAIRRTGFALWPREFSLRSYQLILQSPDLLIGSYIVTILMTVIGTAVGLFVISMTGYALQRKDFFIRNKISFFIYFTSLFTAGLVPFYYVIVKIYGLKDNYLAVLLPLLMNPWLIILMKNFVKAIPHEITESGKIDGAGDFTIFYKLIMPSMTPALATIGLFIALGYWNEWYFSSLFLTTIVKYRPLQYHLYNIINTVASLKNSVASSNVVIEDLPTETLKMATAVLATGPIIFVYPFVQKYFVAGLTVGSVKG
ncbi:MAG TPA: carbohydrate ABC transporter permease [Candidatus Limiplasma sp.]|nr:carbohydrate ABC transporter permease [Candidatus Limiplasma sp.]